ncbi:MAG: AAA family ATPase [Gammaproteobacteria bacterium]|nr:AAA family ATPase [Gammaproteobacteria bacterium]MDH5628957.1 AAA family ATPase [Gammaproteobacteria bacterium]
MYLYHYSMHQLPFGLTPDTHFFHPSQTHIEALNVLNFAISSGEAIVKITGDVGSGKTMLCRMLLNQLEPEYFVAYIPYSKLSPIEMLHSLAIELGIKIRHSVTQDRLSQRIQNRLISLNKKYQSVVLLIDEAQLIDDACLEIIRLFTNIETEQKKLIQIVLFGQEELDIKLQQRHLRQINQRIAFSYHLSPLSLGEISNYVHARLSKSQSCTIVISIFAHLLLRLYSKGVPRLINILCHKSLLLSFGKNRRKITARDILLAAKDTESVNTFVQDHLSLFVIFWAIFVSGSAMAVWGSL